MQKMKIEVWTDIMCPYCYIGKIHYEKALQQFEHADEIELEWKAFQLNPDLPDKGNGYPVKEYLTQTAGYPEEGVNKMFDGIKVLADNAGVSFNLPNAIAANTRDAHRLIKLAAETGKDSFVLQKLSKAYLEEAKDDSELALIISIGDEVGVAEAAMHEMVNRDKYGHQIKPNVQEAGSFSIGAVPSF